jgi:alkylhydroperoxidase family enzyme
MHTEKARNLGESEVRLHLLDAWHESNLFSPRERAALAWAESLTKIAATHPPTTSMRRHGVNSRKRSWRISRSPLR